ncbi:hypothetical protein RJ640_005189 [Escallonia rubra]|uniref:Cysteine-rich receptor-like protein kinase 42 n=1 Tax=Escallonia rubra TaxID=112253 RepID=A0AA88S710_9ASTE|nr:hypothetical protein RJ640_005189 [Escallonia rubra]
MAMNDEYIAGFTGVMQDLDRRVRAERLISYSAQLPSSNIHGFAQCHADLSQEDCTSCYHEAESRLKACLPAVSGRVYLDGCFVRFDDHKLRHENVFKGPNSAKCGEPSDTLRDKNIEMEFAEKLEAAIANVTAMAAVNKGFGAAEVKSGVLSAYALGQCWSTLDENQCRRCLRDAANKVCKCLPGAEGRGMNAGCYLKYSTSKFFYHSAMKKESDSGLSQANEAMVVFIILTLVTVFSLLSLFGALFGYKIYSRRKEGKFLPNPSLKCKPLQILIHASSDVLFGSLLLERKRLARVSPAVSNSNLYFKYELLEQATGCFDPSNKLGQGGCGSVFKGTLPDGRVIAVKRLFYSTRQWADDFFNEVNLISGVQHKNLVRLLGCSIEGPESLLVYEFVPNKSLDQILFDKKNTAQFITWQQRFDIILGIAEGLAHLHDGCEAKIIHRDIKNSNVLLDENLTPKIADFGLARCVAPDRTHVSTAIAGTLGYMAPEYLIRGQLTEKADVYAFGVLALEIACGRKNSVFVNDSGSVLQCVWKHHKSDDITLSIDRSLIGNFPEKKASNALQVGLLCTQTCARYRPSMSSVVQMLTEKENVLPWPKQPPFLNSSVLLSDDTTKSSETNKSSSNWHTTIEVPSTTSKSASTASPQPHVSNEDE